VDDWVDVLDNSTLKPAKITVIVWAYPRTLSAPQAMVGKGDGGVTGTGYNFVIYDWSRAPAFWIYDGTGNIRNLYTYPTLPSANRWYYIAYTYDNITAKGFLDGEYKTYLNASGFTHSTYSLGIGAFSGGGWPFNGLIDEVSSLQPRPL
jgi:hypothetical protein